MHGLSSTDFCCKLFYFHINFVFLSNRNLEASRIAAYINLIDFAVYVRNQSRGVSQCLLNIHLQS